MFAYFCHGSILICSIFNPNLKYFTICESTSAYQSFQPWSINWSTKEPGDRARKHGFQIHSKQNRCNNSIPVPFLCVFSWWPEQKLRHHWQQLSSSEWQMEKKWSRAKKKKIMIYTLYQPCFLVWHQRTELHWAWTRKEAQFLWYTSTQKYTDYEQKEEKRKRTSYWVTKPFVFLWQSNVSRNITLLTYRQVWINANT